MADRRRFLQLAAAAAAAPALSGCAQQAPLPPGPLWLPDAYRKTDRSAVAVLNASRYDDSLIDIVQRGVSLCGTAVRGRRVVLKPNFVEFDPGGVINTNPVLVAAAVQAFRRLDAGEVIVAEGPGHRRDTEYLLTASGLRDVLRDTGARYVDLNLDSARRVTALSRYTTLQKLYIAETVAGADLLVSMPKMKTHHWAGVTLSLKNMFGVLPGGVYGWPKNVLHWAGIEQSILDINASLDVPRLNIVDGIVGMEGNGPIQGRARNSNVLLFGEDPVAVDATAARLMGVDPDRLWYLVQANRFLGNSDDAVIEQRGEDPARLAQDYELIESMVGLRGGLAAGS